MVIVLDPYGLTTFFIFTGTRFHGHFGGTLTVVVTGFFDSHVTTLVAFLVLFLVDTGSLRGNPDFLVWSFCWVDGMLAFVIVMAEPLAKITILRVTFNRFNRSAFFPLLFVVGIFSASRSVTTLLALDTIFQLSSGNRLLTIRRRFLSSGKA